MGKLRQIKQERNETQKYKESRDCNDGRVYRKGSLSCCLVVVAVVFFFFFLIFLFVLRVVFVAGVGLPTV
jgi:hypothetical protein